jgi:hypothetical protein
MGVATTIIAAFIGFKRSHFFALTCILRLDFIIGFCLAAIEIAAKLVCANLLLLNGTQ